MPTARVNIGLGFYQSESVPFANQRCINLYPNVPQSLALSETSLFGTEGLIQVETSNSLALSANRGSILFQGKPYFVNGDILYRLDKTIPVVGEPFYTLDAIGNVNGGRGRVSMAENGDQLIIVNDVGGGYIYAPPNFDAITDAGFFANGEPQKVEYIDRYFVVSTDEKKAIISAVGDGLSWNAVDFISAEADPDAVVAPFVHRNQLYLLGSRTTEQFQNIGGAGVPFRRVNGFVVPVGCSAAESVINVGDVVYWVGSAQNEKPGIWAFTGGSPTKISTTAIENQLNKLEQEEIEAIFSYAYAQKGNTFVHFSLPDNTFVFNPVTALWHERSSEITDSQGRRRTERCRIASVIEAYNDLLAGDLKDGRIGLVDDNTFMEYGEVMIAQFSTNPLQDNSKSFTLPSIELVCETGVGTPTLQDPQVRMEISRDGVQYENPRSRSLGAQGARGIRAIWYKNGRVSSQASMRFTISDPVPRRLFAIDMGIKQSSRQ